MGRKEKPCVPNSTSSATLSERLRLARQAKGISVTDLARCLGYTRGYLSGVETGKTKPSQYLIEGYIKVLKLESDDLYCTVMNKPER